ncbi:hypothetical protein PIB30_084483 [Stylosanthes scabra]|uniref:Uncharacterized protein n=1 Tax=Stylosanthes scabra TaxID=79078 RepID=A0ABU6TVE3_9FABA|nr:hypothetical protein [Stylosanthes scabra]
MDQHEKDLHSIEEQLQNMMWLQQQCLENINKSQVEYMAELRTIKEQNLLGKEILDVKKHQMNTITMGSSSSSNRYEPDQALIKIREQHANFSENQRQLKEWTKNSSARECYSVWAHQQANPNLVEMPVHKITKQIYDNCDNNRPMFYGLLKSDLPPSGTAPPQPKSKDPRDAPN